MAGAVTRARTNFKKALDVTGDSYHVRSPADEDLGMLVTSCNETAL